MMRLLRRTVASLAIAAFTAACKGSEPEPPVVTTVAVTPAAPQVEVGTSVTLTATVRDQKGAPMTGRQVSWRSTDDRIASVGGITGVVTANMPGTTTISATVDGVTGTTSVVVPALPVATIFVSPRSTPLLVGDTATLTATMTDRLGLPVANRQPAWSSSAATVATVDAAGRITATGPGSAVISATADGVTGGTTVVVVSAESAPRILSVTPETLVPGSTVTIMGTNFQGGASSTVVTIGGVAATVLGANGTTITATVPCVQSGSAALRVLSNGIPSNIVTPTVSVVRRTLAAGQSVILATNGEALCNELAPGANARYLVAVYSAATSSNTLVDFELRGNPAAAANVAPRFVASLAPRTEARAETPEMIRDRRHAEWMERERRQYEQARAEMRRMPATRLSASRAAAPLPALGDQRDMYFTFTAGCADTTRVIRGKAIYVGTRSIIWEDTTNTIQSSASAPLADYYQRLGRIFDEDQYDAVKANFGDPLRRDASLDNDGRIHMVFTQRLVGTGAAAYVTSCDQRDPTLSPTVRGSNFGEFFYGFVPTNPGSNLNNTTYVDGWFNFMGRTVVHEVKHIASFSARFANGAPTFESGWLEEGTARHAEEVWARKSLHNVQWKGNTGYGTSASSGLWCDFHPEDAGCNAADALRRPAYGVRRHFNELRDKLLSPWNWSPYGDGTGQTGSVFYQTAWSLVRYAIDRYGSSDANFLTTLNNASTFGTANVAATAGVPYDVILGGWALALYADDYPGLASASADMKVATWNLRSIYNGLNADPSWSARWNTTYPIQPVQLSFGAFTAQQDGMRGGAVAYYELTGSTAAAQLLNLRALGGATPSPFLRMAIARLQ